MAQNKYPEAERLKQIKGVGTLIALTLHVDVGGSKSFPQKPTRKPVMRAPPAREAELGAE